MVRVKMIAACPKSIAYNSVHIAMENNKSPLLSEEAGILPASFLRETGLPPVSPTREADWPLRANPLPALERLATCQPLQGPPSRDESHSSLETQVALYRRQTGLPSKSEPQPYLTVRTRNGRWTLTHELLI